MTASPARQSLAALPDGVRTRLNGWRRSLAEIELAARMGSPDADRHRRQVLAEVAEMLAGLSPQQQAEALPRLARELRVSPRALAALIAAQPRKQAKPPGDRGYLSSFFRNEARRRRRLLEIAAERA